MPIYEYECPNGHRVEKLYNTFADSPKVQGCEACTEESKRVVSGTIFRCSWVPVYVDAKNGWEGTPLDGTDGKNRLTYKSTKVQVDHGVKTQQSGKSKPRPTSGVGALGQ